MKGRGDAIRRKRVQHTWKEHGQCEPQRAVVTQHERLAGVIDLP
jgi:hypothetical protein